MQPSIKLSYFWCTSNWVAWHPIFKDFISLLESGKNILKSTLSPCYSKYVPWPPVALAPPETLLEMQTLRTFSRSAAAAAKSIQLCPTLCDPIDGSPPGSPVPGILQARTLEWVAISSSNAWKWKEKVKSLSRVRLLVTPWTAAYQAPLSMAGGAFSFPPSIFQARVLEWGAIAFSISRSTEP